MHTLSQVADNCPSWISGRERMTVEKISWSISTKECCRARAANSRSPDHQLSAHPTELTSPAFPYENLLKNKNVPSNIFRSIQSLLGTFSLSLRRESPFPSPPEQWWSVLHFTVIFNITMTIGWWCPFLLHLYWLVRGWICWVPTVPLHLIPCNIRGQNYWSLLTCTLHHNQTVNLKYCHMIQYFYLPDTCDVRQVTWMLNH